MEKIYVSVLASLQKTFDILGENSFRLIRANGNRSPINMNVFEVVMYLMSKVKAEQQSANQKIPVFVNELKNNEEFRDTIGDHRDNRLKVEKRFGMIDDFLEELYG